MFELKVQVTDKQKVVSFLKTLSFVSSEYVLLEPDGNLTVKLDDVTLSGYNVVDLLDCGIIDRFLFDGSGFQRKDVAKVIKVETKDHTEDGKQQEKNESSSVLQEVWPAIDLIIKNSTDVSSLATQLYKYLGMTAKSATKFETLVAYYLQHSDMDISWANFRKVVPEFNTSCITTFRKKASDKGYKALELLKYILTSDAVKRMGASNEAEHEEHHEGDDEKKDPQEQTREVVLECMPKLCDTGDEQAVREFEDFLINCDKTQSLYALINDMLKVVAPTKQADDGLIMYAVDALSSVDIDAYVNDESSLAFTKKATRLTWATIATQIAEKYDRLNEKVITAADFLKGIKPYLMQ